MTVWATSGSPRRYLYMRGSGFLPDLPPAFLLQNETSIKVFRLKVCFDMKSRHGFSIFTAWENMVFTAGDRWSPLR